MSDIAVCIDMLRYARSYGSKTEKAFINRFITPLGAAPDEAGNHILRIGDAPVLWSCHTDTVHKKPGKQLVAIKNGIASLPELSKSSCLGGDDTGGVWLMTEMIQAGVPGLYIFHTGEEVGGVGSRHLAMKTPGLLENIRFAIAFDRKGTGSIVTHQFGQRSASDAFARSLAAQLPTGFAPDPDGIFTDTANYVDLVGECTNVSIGYEHAHSPAETLDLNFLQDLLDHLLALDVSQLVAERQPGDWDPADDYYGYAPRQYMPGEYPSLEQLVESNADVAARLLEAYGVTADDFLDEIDNYGQYDSRCWRM